MTSLQLPPPRKSADNAASIVPTTTTIGKQAIHQHQHQQQRGQKQSPPSSTQQSLPPSYETRCHAANTISKLTPEQRKQHPPLFVPRTLHDFKDGGAYPEIHVAQYPRHMGNPHLSQSKHRQPPPSSTGNHKPQEQQLVSVGTNNRAIVNVEIDKDGKVSYDSIVKGGTNSDKIVYTKLQDMKGGRPEDIALPTSIEEQEEAAKTKAAFLSILQQKTMQDKASGSALVNAATSQNVEQKTQFIQYTAKEDAPGYNALASSKRVIQMVPAQLDPLMPPKHQHLKAPRGPAEDPVPVLQAPPKKLTKEERELWNIPACISNWKNSRGYTIPLDKRLAADGRGLVDTSINSTQFAALAESLYVAEQQARQEVRMRALIQKKQVLQERTQREDELRQLANQARLERGGAISRTTLNTNHQNNNNDDDDDHSSRGAGDNSNNKYDRNRDDDNRVPVAVVGVADDVDTEDDIAAKQREKLRIERKREREHELRMEKNLELKKKQKLEEERDVSEKIALGTVIHPTGTGGGSGTNDIDSRLYNQTSGMDSGFGPEDEYNTYTKPLFGDKSTGTSAGTTSIYRPTRTNDNTYYNADEQYDTLRQQGVGAKFQQSGKGFAGAEGSGGPAQHRTAPVQFEKQQESTSSKK